MKILFIYTFWEHTVSSIIVLQDGTVNVSSLLTYNNKLVELLDRFYTEFTRR